MRTGDASLKRIHNQRITAATADVSTESRMWSRDGNKALFFPSTGRPDASGSELAEASSSMKKRAAKAPLLLITPTKRESVAPNGDTKHNKKEINKIKKHL